MATFWFVSAPLLGHLDWGGFLKTALALQSAGHHVNWVSQPTIGAYLSEKGLPFSPIPQTGWLWPPPPPPDPNTLPPQQAVFIRYKRALDTWLSEDLISTGVQNLLELAEQDGAPDAIVTDPFLTASAIAAEKMGAKLAVCGWPATTALDENHLFAVQRELAEDSRGRIRRLCQQYDVRGVNFSQGPTPSIQSPHLHISYFSAYWHQGDPPFLPQTHFVGGIAQAPLTEPPAWMEHLPDTPIVLITLGSVFTGDLGFFAWAAQATHRLGWTPVVVIGRNPISPEDKAELKSALPAGTFLLNWVDYDHLFPRLSLIVHHGGMGTTHAAVVHAVPQVVVPHAADQRGQAKRASQAKVGLHLTAHEVKNGHLMTAIRALGTDEKVRDQCRWLAQEFATLGGATRAAALLAGLLPS